MRQPLRRHIPSMFERRLLLLVGLALGIGLVLIGRTAQLTLGDQHRQLLDQAQRALWRTTYIPTVRGRILDRRGNVLAENRPGFDVAVSFDVLTGEWAFDRAAVLSKREHKDIWSRLAPEQREAIIARSAKLYQQQIAELFRVFSELGGDMQGIDAQELEQRRNAIIAEVQQTAAEATLRRQADRLRELDESVTWAEARIVVSEQTEKHSLLRDVNEQVRLTIEGFIADAERALAQAQDDPSDAAAQEQSDALAVWRQVELTRPKHRRYPYETVTGVTIDRTTMPPELRSDQPVTVEVGGVALAIIGRMRAMFAEDLTDQTRFHYWKEGRLMTNLAGYQTGDRVGSSGIEASVESTLRGVRGQSVRRLDSGLEQRIDPVPGRDVALTIDLNLQAKLQALLSAEVGLTVVQPYHHSARFKRGEAGQPLSGAVVILDVHNSEVLAAVSFPGYSLKQLEENPDSVFKNPWHYPNLFRPIEAAYPPGSTIKPILLASAVTAGRLAVDEQIACDGPLDPAHPNRFRCWIFRHPLNPGGRHGLLDGAHAIEQSCNIYFYTAGRKMGLERLTDWYGRWGLGRRGVCGLNEELAGSLPNPDRYPQAGWQGIATNMGIGQGPMRCTPLQMAAAFATLARGGIYIPPTFILDTRQPRPQTDLRLHNGAVAEAMEGLDLVINDPDSMTGHWLDRAAGERTINAGGVKVFGKSGTADPGVRWVDVYPPGNPNGRQDKEDLYLDEEGMDHAWFVGLVRPEHAPGPMYAIATVVEYAGSGSKVSGPIVNQVIHLLQREGWL